VLALVANRLLLLAASCLVPVALAFPAEAQQRQQRPQRAPAAAPASTEVVRAIDVTGNQRIEADTIRSYMLLQPGDRFDADRLDRSLRTLFATGLFRDVRVSRQGDRIAVQVEENPIVNRVAFEGNSKVSDDNLRPDLTLRPRAVFTPQIAQADRQRILDVYARRGRFAARVEPKIIQLDQNRVDVVFEITEGDAALVSRVNFVGNTAFSDGRLRDVVSTREQAWYRLLSTSDIYDPERLAFDRELLRRYYLRNGYADVQLTAATASSRPDRSGFFVTFTIDEGPPLPHRQHRLNSRCAAWTASASAASCPSPKATGTTAMRWSARWRRFRIASAWPACPSSRCARASPATARRAASTSPSRSRKAPGPSSSASTSPATTAPRTASSAASSAWRKATRSTPRRCAGRASASATSAISAMWTSSRWRARAPTGWC
jgi:hypothetical protein